MKQYNQEECDQIFIQEPDSILKEVKYILSLTGSEVDYKVLDDIFNDTKRLFKGTFKGYQPCRTKYHDLNHTLSVFLATSRLIHGAFINGRTITPEVIMLGLVSALLHDAGLIQTEDDFEGTGAKYTTTHEERSIIFMKNYLISKNFYKDYLDDCAHIIGCTITRLSPKEIPFRTREIELIGKIMGSADLLAQIADRAYLEKLLYLHQEFQEAKIPGFESEYDFFKKTELFYKNVAKRRLEKELGGVAALMRVHFKSRFGVDRDYYQENIENNLEYFKITILNFKRNYRQTLRRAGIVSELEKVNN